MTPRQIARGIGRRFVRLKIYGSPSNILLRWAGWKIALKAIHRKLASVKTAPSNTNESNPTAAIAIAMMRISISIAVLL